MNGRTEKSLKVKTKTMNLLNDMPECCTGFYYSIKELSPTTCFDYLFNVKKFLEYTNKDIKQIDEVDIGKYFDHIEFRENAKGKYVPTSAAYKRITYASLNKFFTYLNKKHLIDVNPMTLIERTKKKDDVKKVSLTMDEINKMLDVAKSGLHNKDYLVVNRDYLIIYLFIYTGMRKSALSQINLEDINFKEKTLSVYEKRDKIFVYDLDDRIMKTLSVWLKERETIIRRNGIINSTNALFINRRGGRLEVEGIYKLIKKYSLIANGYDISPHKLRASFVTLFYEASGHDIEAVRKAVGHESIETTSRYIVKKNNARKQAAKFMSSNLS